MLNRCIIQGRVVRDPELRRTTDDTAVTTVTLAVERDYRDKATGEREADFIEVSAFRGTAEFIARNFSKGRMMIAEGRLRIRAWEDGEGNRRKAAEVAAENVYFCDSRREDKATAPDRGEPLPWDGEV